MMLLRAFMVLAGEGSVTHAARARTRRLLRRGRRVVAGAMAPVLAGGLSLVPVTVAAATVAGVAAVSVAHATPARAATTGPVLVLLQNGESTAPETTVLQNAGYTVTQVTPSTWAGMTQAQFEGYAALVIGDPSSSSCSTTVPGSLGTAWQSAVSGNIAVLGTAPALAGTTGANALVRNAAEYATAGYSGSSGTGLYLSLNCDYATASAGTSVSLLANVEGIGNAGGVTVQGGLACGDAGTVNTWEAESSGTFAGFTSGSLGSGSWPSPACPVQEAFDSWPAMFTPLAYDTASDASNNFTASDGAKGQPYVLLGAPVSAGTQALAPSTGGEVPAGSTAGGTSNPAAPGVAQGSAGDPVNTENGDFTQSSTDVSLPGFGPALDFTRTYDAQAAQQEMVNHTPGAMGYGWTDDWASSLTQASPVPGDIYTLTGTRTDTGQGGPPTQAALNLPQAMVSGSDTYIVDTGGNRVEEIPGTTKTEWGKSMTAGDIYTIAGSDTGTAGDSPNGTAAGQTALDQPAGIAFDSAGNMFIADTGNERVIEIPLASGTYDGIAMTANESYTIAGVPGQSGVGADKEAATSSDLNQPQGLSVASGTADDVYIADAGNNRIQEVSGSAQTEWGQSMSTGDVYTVAGSAAGTAGTSGMGGAATSAKLDHPEGVVIKSTGLYIADTDNDQIAEVALTAGAQWGVSSMTANDIYTIAGRDGQPAVGGDNKAATSSDLDLPSAITVANGPNIYVADTANNRIQEVAGSAHTEWGQSMTQYYVYTVAGPSSGGASGDSGDGGAASSALMDAPAGVALDTAHDLVLADTLNNEVREVNVSTADISDYAGGAGTFATDGDSGPAALSGLDNPRQEAFDTEGDIYIADSGGNRIQEIAAYSHTQFGISMTAGDIYTIAGQANGTPGCQCDGHPATQAYLDGPEGIVIDASGDLYIADTGNNRIQEVPASTGTQWGQSMTAGYMYTVAGQQYGSAGYWGDGGPATSAGLNSPHGLAVDAAGDIYIADGNNSRIQEVPASSGTQWGQSMTAGDMYTIAGSPTGAYGNTGDGGPAANALLYGPGGIALDSAGDLFIGDGGNNRLQEVPASNGTWFGQQMTGGDMYTIAGGTWGSAGDGGPAVSATLDGPESVAVDPGGDVYFADTGNNRIQEIAAASGTQWAQSMTAGDIYTVAGSATGAAGNSGDGGLATSALMNITESISLDPAGDMYITDNTNNTIREVAAENASYIPGTSLQLASAMVIAQTGEVPAGVTVTQPGGAQITFYPKTGGSCASPYQAAGSYCALPQYTGATLSYSSSTQVYTFSPSPGTSYTYAPPASGSGSLTWSLTSETDSAGDTLTLTDSSPAPGSGQCPSSAHSCDTITAASGRTLVIGMDASGLVTSVTDPLGREWQYGYSAGDLVSAQDPKGNVTTYTYDNGNSNPQLVNDLLTITKPNAQPGGPDAGDSTVNVYDSLGRVTSQTDPMGFQTTFHYSGMDPATGTGTVTTTDPDGNSTVDEYVQGTLAAESKWTGSTLTSEQDYGPDTTAGGTSGGTLLDAWTTDGDGNQTTNSYDAAGNIISTTDPLGNETTQASTSLDQTDCSTTAEAASGCSSAAGPTPVTPGGVITPPSSAPPQGVTWTLYDTSGNQLYQTTGVYQPGSSSASYLQTTYQLFKGNTVTLNSTSISCSYTPPSSSLPCATINADGVVTQLTYDSAGDLTSSATPDGNGSQIADTTSTYDADGEQTATTSPDGNVSGANAGNYTTTTSYNADGHKTAVTQAGGSGATVTPRTTNYGYDADGNQTTVQDARGYTTTTAYNADDESTLVTDPDGNATLTCYDGEGNTTQTVPPTGVAADSLTAASCPSSYPSGYGNRLTSDATTYTYDANGDQTVTTTPAPAGQSGYETTTSSYDGVGNLTETIAPPTSNSGGSNNDTYNTYNSDGQITSTTLGYSTTAASTTSFCYNPNGQRTSVVYPDGNTSAVAGCESSSPWVVSSSAYPTQASYQITSSYDSAGELVSTTSPATAVAPSGATTTDTYDPAGNQLTSKDPNGVTTSWTYTPADLKATVAYSGSSAHSVSYSYDADGQETAMTDGTGSSSYGYDPFGELTSATNGAGQNVGYGYNADGETTSITYPLPWSATWATTPTVTDGYDHADQLSSVTDFNSHTISISNTSDGLPYAETLGSSGDTLSTTYDATDTPEKISLTNSSTTLQSFTYADAPSGAALAETDTPSSSQSPADYTYDAQDRVTSMTPGSGSALNYGYDASGSLTTLPTGAIGTYDDAGELTSSVLGSTTTSYTYDADGQRLTTKQGSTTITSGTWNGASQLTAYDSPAANMTAATYDGNGLRAATTTGGTTQEFTWNTQNTQLLMDSTNAYIYAAGDTPAEQVNLSTGTITYLNADSLGSVRGIISSSGSLTATSNYDAWGNPETSGGLTATTPFGYAGAYTDPSGLLYLINRYYDPATGQFISVDPDIAQTNAPYAYATGNPVTNTDPTGLAVLKGSTRCNNYRSTGNWQATICIQTQSHGVPKSHVWSAAQIVFKVRSGGIAVAGFGKMGLDVCSNTGKYPGHPVDCSHNNVVASNERVICAGSNGANNNCSLETGQYVSRRVNWITPWATGVWLHWTNGQHFAHNISITGYQRENGNCGGGKC